VEEKGEEGGRFGEALRRPTLHAVEEEEEGEEGEGEER